MRGIIRNFALSRHSRRVPSVVRVLFLRAAILLCLAVAAVNAVVLGGEYPGATAHRILLQEVLPLTLLAWAHLAVLDRAGDRSTARRFWPVVALCGDVALFIRTAPDIGRGAPPLTLLLPIVAVFLLATLLAVVLQTERS
jgi:hypothetical protein